MNKASNLLFFFAFLFSISLIADDQSQQNSAGSPPLSYGVEVGLAQIVLRVTDSQGHWISNLQPGDFELKEDGKIQQILYLDEIGSAQPIAQQELIVSAGHDSTEPSNQRYSVDDQQNAVLIIFDGCNSSMNGLEKQKARVLDFLNGFHTTNTVFALSFLDKTGNYKVIQDFTPNPQLLVNSLNNLTGSGGIEERRNELLHLTNSDQIDFCLIRRAGFDPTPCIQAAENHIVDEANMLAMQEQARAAKTVLSLRQLFDRLRAVRGQKSGILLTEGFDPGGGYYFNYAENTIRYWTSRYDLIEFPEILARIKSQAARTRSNVQQLRKLEAAANASDIAIYWVNPEFGKALDDIAADGSQTMTHNFKTNNALDIPSAFRGLAEDTGGAALNSSDMAKFYSQLQERISKYYVVSYKPNRPVSDGKFHRIEIKTKNSKYSVSYRKDFFDLSPNDRINIALANSIEAMDDADLKFMHEIHFIKKSPKKYTVTIQVSVPFTEINPRIETENVSDDIHFAFVIRDKKGNVSFEHHSMLQVRSRYEEYQQHRKDGESLEYSQNVELNPGEYDVSVVSVDSEASKTGTRITSLQLPDGEECLSVSPIMLASNVSPSENFVQNPTVTEKGEIAYGKQLLRFSIDRVYAASGLLQGFFQVFARQPHFKMLFRLFTNHSHLINETASREISQFTDQERKLVSNFFSLPYKNLPPGSYELEIAVQNENNTCTSSARAAFSVSGINPGFQVDGIAK